MPMPAGTETLATAANHWLAQFEQALGARGDGMLGRLFHRDCHWRDVLALTWRIQTVSGVYALAREMKTQAAGARPTGWRPDPARTPPRQVTRAGTKCIEAIFRFETAEGHGSGLLRLLPEDKEPRAWTLLTALEELKDHEEQVGGLRPSGHSYSRDFGGPNWLDLRKAASRYDDREPTGLGVGGGQTGLSIPARLKQRHVDTLIVDRWPRGGDKWRPRYPAPPPHN